MQQTPSWEIFALVENRADIRLLTGQVAGIKQDVADLKQSISDSRARIKRYLILAGVWAIATGLNIAPKETAQILMALLKAIAESLIKTG